MKHSILFCVMLVVVGALLLPQHMSGQWVSAGNVTNIGTFPSISVVNGNTAWIAGGPNGTPVVYRTTNAGTSWTAIGSGGLVLEMYCVWGSSDDVAYVGNGGASGGAGGNAKFFSTTTGGTVWSLVDSTAGTAGFFNGIVFSRVAPAIGIAQSDPPAGAGQPYFVSKTTDGGASWTRTSPPGISGAASAQNSIVVIDENFYGFGLNASPSRVYLTSNGGSNWYIGTLGITGGFISGVAFKDDKLLGLAASSTSLPNIARTTNGGVSWTTVNVGSGATGYCNLKWIPGTNTCYLSGTAGIKKSTDGGLTWTSMTLPAISGTFTHMEFAKVGSTVTGFAVTTTGTVIKVTETVTSVEPETSGPERLSLKQNYPNPFNPNTHIRYALLERASVTLSVYDLLGKQVSVIVENEVREPGEYETTWDGRDMFGNAMPSGTYLVRLQSGTYTETKRMMLLK